MKNWLKTFVLVAGVLVFALGASRTLAQTWDGGGANSNWSTVNNWNPNTAPVNNGTAIINFAGSTRTNVVLDLSWSINRIIFTNGGGAFTLTSAAGAVLTLGAGGITNSNTITQTITITNILLGAAQTWNASAGDLVINSIVTNAGFLLTFDGANDTLFNGSLIGTGGLTKNGAGILSLGGSNSMSGTVTLTAGTLSVSNDYALGTGGLTISGGTIQAAGTGRTITNTFTASGDFTVGGASNLTFSGPVTITANRIITVNNTATTTISGQLGQTAGTPSFTKAGTGELVLSASNSYTGTTVISGGVLRLAHTNALGGGNLTFNGGVLGLASGGFTRALGTGAGQVQWTGSGGFAAYSADRNVNLGGASATVTWNSGSFIPTGSTLILGASGADATVTFQNPINLAGAVRTVQVDNGSATIDAILSGALTGTGSSGLTKTGAGTLVVSNAGNTYAGTTTVSAGTLRATTSSNALGAGTLTLSGGTLELANDTGLIFNRNTTVFSSSTIRSDVLTSGGAGVTHTLGSLIIDGQTLTIEAGANVGSGTAGVTFGSVTNSGGGAYTMTFDVGLGAKLTLGAINPGGAGDDVIVFTGAGDSTVSGILADSFGASTAFVTKSGTGTLTLATANLYEDVTTISGGVVKVQNNTSLGATAAGTTVASGAAIQIDGSGLNVAEGITSLAGDGGGTGALRNLSNNNTWSGAIAVENTGARINSDAGTLTLSGGFTENGGSLKTLTFGGAGNITVSTAITAGSGDLAVTKDGAGTLTLSAANTYDGGTIINAGTVNLDYTTVGSKLADGGVLTLAGGTLTLLNGASAHTEVVASTTIAAGASSVTRGSGTSVLRMNAITRNAGGTVNFGAASIAQTDTANVNGILGAWATINGTDWAINSTGGGDGPITAYTGYTDRTRLSSGTKTITSLATSNVRIVEGTGGAASLTPAAAGWTTINTLLQSASGGTSAATYDPGATDVLRLGTTGAIMIAPTAGALTIGTTSGDGILTAGATTNTAGDLILINNSTATMTINSVVTNNGTGAITLTKSGAGLTILAGTNSYTGQTYINAGTLQIGAGGTTGQLGSTANVNDNGSLVFNRSDAITVANVISGTGSLTQNGAGATTLSGNNSYSGGFTNNAGSTLIGNANALGSGGITLNGGTLASDSSTVRTVTNNVVVGGNIILGQASGGTGALTFSGIVNLGSANRTISVSNAVSTFSNNVTGIGGIVQNGIGKLVFGSPTDFSGDTTINTGVLEASVAGALGGTASLTVNTGGTLLLSGAAGDRIKNTAGMTLNGGLFNLGGLSETLGTLTLSANSAIDFGSAIANNTLTFANSSGATWSGTLSINNWGTFAGSETTSDNDHLFFGGSAGGLTVGQVGAIQFVNPAGLPAGTYAAVILGSGEVVPVPEPATCVGAVALGGVLAFRERRRLHRWLSLMGRVGAWIEARPGLVRSLTLGFFAALLLAAVFVGA